MTLDLSSFERGGNLQIVDGAWFCIPTMPQIYAGPDKRVLIMQLTTDGVIDALINLQGKSVDDVMWRAEGVEFKLEP
jgi:hypothetical protein